jgi:hypothetical protein
MCSALLTATIQSSHAVPAAFPLERGEVVMTGASALDGFCLRVFDVRSPGSQPFGQNWLAPVFHDSTWTAVNLGEVFGVCLDSNSPPNIYVTATSVYGTGSFGPGSEGGVYKIDGSTGAISVFANLPSGPASLGNICFDAAHNQFFVSELDAGLIYRLDHNGVAQAPTYDHGVDGRANGLDLNGQSVGLAAIPDDHHTDLTPAGRRVWGVQVRDGRLYYSVWNNDRGQPDPDPVDEPTVNEIWSIAIHAGDGSFNLTDIRRELSLPRFSINGVQNWSSPVSDISFSGHGKMLLGERSVSTSADRNSYGGDGNSATYAHVSRVLEYEFQASPAAWLNLSGAQYFIGFFSSFSNAAGGVDYDCDDRVFATGDALIHNGTTSVYGLQIIPSGGNTLNSVISTSYLVDLDGSTGYNTDKTQIGDVALYHADCERIACLAITCPTNKTVQCGASWAFDEPIATDACTHAILPMSIVDTVTNNLCPLAITRSWTLTYPAGYTNTCSQTVSVMPPLTFFTPTLDNSLQSTHTSPYGNGSIKVSLAYTPMQSFAQYSTTLFPSTFPVLFPNANNNWLPPAGTYLATLSFNGPFTVTIDLSNYHNLPSRFVFGLYNFRNSGYTLKAYDSTGAQIVLPLPWHLIGNDDDALHPQAATHLGLDLNTGLFSTVAYQTGGQSDAAFWNNIPIDSGNNLPSSTAKIVISGSAGNQNDYIGVYFAEYAPNPPIFNCPPDKTVECGTAWTFDTPTATNSCSGTDATITVLDTATSSTDLSCQKTFTRTWIATDLCGNTNICSQTVTEIDTTPPIFACPTNKTVNCGDAWTFDAPAVTDNCSGTNVTLSIFSTVETNDGCAQIFTRTWIATDACTNTATCSQTVTVAAPLTFFTGIINSPKTSTYTSPYGNGNITLSASGNANNDPSLWSSKFPTLFPGANNTWANPAQAVRVIGSGDFTITVDLTQYHNLSPGFVVGFYNIQDNLNPGGYSMAAFNQSSVQISPPFGWNLIGNEDDFLHLGASAHMQLNPNGTFLSAHYQSGSGSDAAFWNQIPPDTATIVISGNLPSTSDGVVLYFAEPAPPILTCSTNKTVNCGTTWTFDPPTVTGVCSGGNAAGPSQATITVLETVTNGVCPMVITRTWQAADACSNTTTCSQTVTVVNTNPPVILCPANILVTSCTATQIFYAPTATAGCDTNVTVFCTPPSPQIFLPGTTNTIFCVASNCAGTAKCSFTVTVSCFTNNCAGLVLECPQDIIVDCKDDFGAIVSFPPPKTTNTCCPGPIEVLFSPAAGQFPIGVTPVICTARDSCGNTQQCTFNVVVQGHGPGKWTWANRAGGERVDSGNAVAVDHDGNVLVTGSFTGEMNFPGTGITLSGFGDTDIFVAKYNRLGSLLWAVRAGGRGPDAGYGIAVDQAGNVFVTGGFTGSASFGSVSLSSIGGRDIFIAKYDPNGVLLCAIRDGDKGDDFGSAITVTGAGAVFLTGKWDVAGVAQAFVTKMGGERDCSISGTLISADGSAVGRAIAPDASGDVYVTGGYTDKTSFGSQTVTAPTGFQRIFVAKFNGAPAAPTCGWAQSSSGPKASGQHDGTGIAVSGKDCFITGYFSGQADFAGLGSVSNTKTGGVYDYLIAKFDLQGTLAWVIKGGGSSADDEETRGIAVNQEGNPCVTGFLHPNAPGPFVNEGSSVLVASYSGASGLLQWTRNAMDGPAGPTPNSPEDVGLGIAMDSAGCVHVTGAFTEDLGFLPAATLHSIPTDARDMFVAKMCQTCCNAVTDSRIKRIGHNQYLYEFCYQNSTPDVISYLFLVPDPAIGNCYNFMPDLIALGAGSAYGPVIPPGGTGCFTGEHGITITTKEGCEPRICFYLSAHNDKFNVCCAVRQCLTLRNIVIADPIDGGTFSLNTNIVVHLVDSTVDPTNQITDVKFRLGDTIVATDFMAPFETALQGLSAGPYRISAIATDNEGLISESLPVTFTVNPASAVEAAVALTQNPDRTLTVSWPQGENWMLQEAVTVSGPWSNAASQTSPMKLTPGGTNKFYRLAKP